MSDILGLFTKHDELSAVERTLVKVAMNAPDRAHCFQSNFPVGSAVLAANEEGMVRMFHGCNVENNFMPATICAERNAVTTAVMEGYKRLQIVAVFCRKYPGGSPCGVCRQVLTQFGRGAILLNVVDHDGNVRRGNVDELLPAASGTVIPRAAQSADEQKLVKAALVQRSKSHAPYTKIARGAVLVGFNAGGKRRAFKGAVIENASYGASVGSESAAMTAARLAGYVNKPTLVVTVNDVKNLNGHNPIDGECLQILREFGLDCQIILVGEDQSLVRTTLVELLPDSFGPNALEPTA
jgi:cytidine deaminase